ncbi:hypothetical protein ACFQ4Q_22610, partial [Lysobacter gummosus]|uniref:hypothetical protein n=1 Tax=Lysobacter gummosus TaxID=262324 RepID=UPI00362AA977
FFVQSDKESNQRKRFGCFESKATSAMLAQAGATLGILPKVAPGARPCAPPFGCPSVSRVTGGAQQRQRQRQKQRRSRNTAKVEPSQNKISATATTTATTTATATALATAVGNRSRRQQQPQPQPQPQRKLATSSVVYPK